MPRSLRYIREAKGMTLTALAEESGIARQTIAYIERGDRMTRAETVRKLAKGLGVDPLDLVMEPGESETEESNGEEFGA